MERRFGMVGRRQAAKGLAAFAMAMLLGGVETAAAQATRKPNLRPVRLITSGSTLTIAIVLEMLAGKYDEAHGISVEPTFAGGASSLMIDAVVSGAADFGNPGTLTALQAIRQGAPIKIVAAVSNNQLTAVISQATLKKVSVSPSASIGERVRALKGLTIAVNPVGSNYYQMTRAFLKQNGVDPDRDVRLLPIADASAMISSVKQGRADGMVGASGVVEQVVVDDAGTVWFSGLQGDMPGAENVPVSLIVASDGFIDKQRPDVDALRAALTDALAELRHDPAATGRALKEQYLAKLSPAVWTMAWSSVAPKYPSTLAFSRKAFDYWIANDPKGASSYKDVDYTQAVYGPAQAP